MAALLEDVRIWVTERKPKTSEEAGQFAEDYLQARSTTTPTKPEQQPPGPCPRCLEHGLWARYCPNKPRTEGATSTKTYGYRPSANGQTDNSKEGKMHHTPSVRSSEFRPRFMDGVKCYSCNEKGHLASNCPQKALFCSLLPSQPCQQQTERVCRHGTLNGTYSQDIVIDTGASKTLVRSQPRYFRRW